MRYSASALYAPDKHDCSAQPAWQHFGNSQIVPTRPMRAEIRTEWTI
jgi:hypothetical protein